MVEISIDLKSMSKFVLEIATVTGPFDLYKTSVLLPNSDGKMSTLNRNQHLDSSFLTGIVNNCKPRRSFLLSFYQELVGFNLIGRNNVILLIKISHHLTYNLPALTNWIIAIGELWASFGDSVAHFIYLVYNH